MGNNWLFFSGKIQEDLIHRFIFSNDEGKTFTDPKPLPIL